MSGGGGGRTSRTRCSASEGLISLRGRDRRTPVDGSVIPSARSTPSTVLDTGEGRNVGSASTSPFDVTFRIGSRESYRGFPLFRTRLANLRRLTVVVLHRQEGGPGTEGPL